ncbi:M24 family metallopeptidase [Algihabitans albus]|uniref:M24 family metallopeptidase n=1 Tax=Algihabitans albus TaxID=2164067 RepID=UPI001ABD3A25|nr:Xaa-Pro peptidase family protein [Algihabitans albus]
MSPASDPNARSLVQAGFSSDPPVSNPVALRAYRLARLRAELRARDYAGLLVTDPINIRYATGTSNMQVWALHNAVRYAFVPTEGPVVLFDFHGGLHLSAGIETVAEVRPALSWFYFIAGAQAPERAALWAREIADLLRAEGGGNRRLAVDKCEPLGVDALRREGVEIRDGQEVCERARAIKSPDEVIAMRRSVAVAEEGMAKMQAVLTPGMTENELWSHLHQVNIARGGEWIETRLLASGRRSNPWFQECSDKPIAAGELVSFDTDLIGPDGLCADISRSFLCGQVTATVEQKRLYGLAREQIEANIALLRPGLRFAELAERSWRLPETCRPNRYSVIAHGVGLCDEYPHCGYVEDNDRGGGYDGVFSAGMTICMESYIGEEGGDEGVKLEEQLLITETGVERLSRFPYEEVLMPSRWL